MAPYLLKIDRFDANSILIFISSWPYRGFAETKGQVSSQVAGDQVALLSENQQMSPNVRTQSLQNL